MRSSHEYIDGEVCVYDTKRYDSCVRRRSLPTVDSKGIVGASRHFPIRNDVVIMRAVFGPEWMKDRDEQSSTRLAAVKVRYAPLFTN